MNFTTDITEQNAYFTISGNYSESKGSVIYNGMTLTKCLKIETATSISFTCDTDSELTLVFNSNFAKKIKIDGVKTAATNGIVKVKVAKGTHTITKGDTTNLFYIISIFIALLEVVGILLGFGLGSASSTFLPVMLKYLF